MKELKRVKRNENAVIVYLLLMILVSIIEMATVTRIYATNSISNSIPLILITAAIFSIILIVVSSFIDSINKYPNGKPIGIIDPGVYLIEIYFREHYEDGPYVMLYATDLTYDSEYRFFRLHKIDFINPEEIENGKKFMFMRKKTKTENIFLSLSKIFNSP